MNDTPVRAQLLASGLVCPLCGEKGVSPDALTTRGDIRNSVEGYIKDKAKKAALAVSGAVSGSGGGTGSGAGVGGQEVVAAESSVGVGMVVGGGAIRPPLPPGPMPTGGNGSGGGGGGDVGSVGVPGYVPPTMGMGK